MHPAQGLRLPGWLPVVGIERPVLRSASPGPAPLPLLQQSRACHSAHGIGSPGADSIPPRRPLRQGLRSPGPPEVSGPQGKALLVPRISHHGRLHLHIPHGTSTVADVTSEERVGVQSCAATASGTCPGPLNCLRTGTTPDRREYSGAVPPSPEIPRGGPDQVSDDIPLSGRPRPPRGSRSTPPQAGHRRLSPAPPRGRW